MERGKNKGEDYRKKKLEYKKYCEEKKEQQNKRFEKEVEKARTEEEVWKIVNRERKRWKGLNEEIEMSEWKNHFMELLGGVEKRVRKGKKEGREEDEEEGISRKEIDKVIENMKDKKAAGIDEIPNEVWKYGGEKMRVWAWKMCNRIWKGEGWPEIWKEGLVTPIIKKESGEVAKDYRKITLMSTLYKIYTSVLMERVKEELEKKEIIPDNQTEFRKGMGVMDNIYVLNYLINKRLKAKKTLVAIFVNLKACFDSLDRKLIEEAMEKNGIRKGLRVRVAEIFKEIKSRVKVGEKVGDCFWLARGVRQGCPISPMLFNILIVDLEEEMRKKRWGGIKM